MVNAFLALSDVATSGLDVSPGCSVVLVALFFFATVMSLNRWPWERRNDSNTATDGEDETASDDDFGDKSA